MMEKIGFQIHEKEHKLYPAVGEESTMSEERYAIIFSSLTGNTRKLADTIHETLPAALCDYFGEAKSAETNAELVYVGFWTDKGTADKACLELLRKLRNKKIFLFGTAGFGGSEAYYQKILTNVHAAIDGSNTVVGEYMCQGKMPQSVRDRYVKMKEMPDAKPNLDALIANFDRALSHPDEADLNGLRRKITG